MNLGHKMDGGFLPPIQPNATREEQIKVMNDVINRLNASLETNILSDGTTKRMLFGYQAGGWKNGTVDFGIKISMEGIDVTQASSEQLLFSMDMATWRWFDPTSRNFVNIGLRSIGTHGFEMAKPTDELHEPA